MTTLAVRSRDEEQMDALDLDFESYGALLADLSKVNRLLMSSRPTLAFLKRAIGDRTRFKLLDVGYGHGDMLRSIAAWAKARGIDAELVGIDLNPRSEIVAKAATPTDMQIDYRTGDYADLAGAGFDLVVSSFVAHHMGDDQLIDFLRFMEQESKIGWMVNDLRRSAVAHTAYPWLARIMGWHRIVREDGTLSIARSFREADWSRYLNLADGSVREARIVRRLAFRLCVERIR